MARYCGACGEPLDAEHHDVEVRKRLFLDGNRWAIRRGRVYGCRTRLIATSPLGKTFVPSTAQRIERVNNRHVLARRFEEGGDLHA